MRSNTEQDFWNRVEIKAEDECWNWLGSLSTDGHGQFKFKGRNIAAHKFAYTTVKGSTNDLYVLHDCMNKLCCNPKHLVLGTHAQNTQYPDRAKLNWVTVQFIRLLCENKIFTQKRVASMFKLSEQTISEIVRQHTWRN